MLIVPVMVTPWCEKPVSCIPGCIRMATHWSVEDQRGQLMIIINDHFDMNWRLWHEAKQFAFEVPTQMNLFRRKSPASWMLNEILIRVLGIKKSTAGGLICMSVPAPLLHEAFLLQTVFQKCSLEGRQKMSSALTFNMCLACVCVRRPLLHRCHVISAEENVERL